MQFRLGSKVTGVAKTATALAVSVAPAKGEGATETLAADVVLVAIGRRPYTEGSAWRRPASRSTSAAA